MGEPAVRMQGIVKRLGRFTLEVPACEIREGAALGWIGPNGAGKSTLLRIVLGLVRADAGTIEVLGRPMPDDEREIKRQVGFVSEDMALYGAATVRWHMDFVRRFCPAWDETRARELLETLGVDPGRRARGMSRGEHVKAMLMLALARRPRLLVLDEPLAGLDPLARDQAMSLLGRAGAEGTTVLFSSHHGEDVGRIATEIAFVCGGRIIDRGPAETFLRDGRSLEQAFRDRVEALGAGRAA